MNKVVVSILLVSILSCKSNPLTPGTIKEDRDWWLWAAACKPDGTRLAVGGTQDTLRIFSMRDDQASKKYPLPGTVTKLRWHPSKDKLAVALQNNKGKTQIIDFNSDATVELDSIAFVGARGLGWNHDGSLLAVGDNEGALIIYSEKGELIKRVNADPKGITGLSWHPHHNKIVTVGSRIGFYDLKTDRLELMKSRTEEVLMLCVEWHPTGTFFVTADYGDFVEHYPPLLKFWTPDGRNIKEIKRSKAEYRNLRWSPEGEILATASDYIRLWTKEGVLIREEKSENLLWGIDWDTNGENLVTTDFKGKIIVWNKELVPVRKLIY